MGNFRIGLGYDVHRLEEGYPLWLCGVRVECEFGAVGHSDADTPTHALCDALLGALALGDIGKHFPDTDPAYHGISSLLLLEQCYEMVEKRGFRLSNADIVIALQRPKIQPYIEQMRATLAECLQAPVETVSVKATTTERLGFVGEGRGIMAQAVVLLEKPVNASE